MGFVFVQGLRRICYGLNFRGYRVAYSVSLVMSFRSRFDLLGSSVSCCEAGGVRSSRKLHAGALAHAPRKPLAGRLVARPGVSLAAVCVALVMGATTTSAAQETAPEKARTKAQTKVQAKTHVKASETVQQAGLRTPAVTLSIIVPEVPGLWTMELRNSDVVPARVIADARKLSLLVRGPQDRGYTFCRLPSTMVGPARQRALVLHPEQTYREAFDPRLYCWGDVAKKLVHGASVTGFLGWDRDEKLDKKNAPQQPPFALEPVDAPATFAPQKRIVSMTMPMPAADVVQADPAAPSPPLKELSAPQLRLTSVRWSDVVNQREATILATLRNDGDRDALVHVRADDLVLHVRRPDGTVAQCGPGSPYRSAVRDFFTTIKPGQSKTIKSLLSALCAENPVNTPGLYTISVRLVLRETGKSFGLDAVTGEFAAPVPTLLRVQHARQPFYSSPPRAAGPPSQRSTAPAQKPAVTNSSQP